MLALKCKCYESLSNYCVYIVQLLFRSPDIVHYLVLACRCQQSSGLWLHVQKCIGALLQPISGCTSNIRILREPSVRKVQYFSLGLI